MAADADGLGERAAQASGGRELILGLVALEDLPDLEQRHVGAAAVGIALRRHHQPGNEARPHIGELGRDRIGQCQSWAAAAEQLGLAFAHE